MSHERTHQHTRARLYTEATDLSAEASHAAGQHGLSEAQAQASKWLAEQVK